jgi:hypothetical protein
VDAKAGQWVGQPAVNACLNVGQRLVNRQSKYASMLVNRQSTHLAALAPIRVRVEGEGHREAEVGARVSHNIKVQHTALRGGYSIGTAQKRLVMLCEGGTEPWLSEQSCAQPTVCKSDMMFGNT